MEVDLEIYSHLIKTGVLEGGFNNPEHKVQLEIRKVLLDKDTSILFENGIAFARYLIYIKRKLESMDEQQSRIHYKIDEGLLTQLRSGVAPSIRLHNWNIIIKEIMKIGIKVNADMKSLLVAGDYGIIFEYLKQLHNFELVQSGNQDGNINAQLDFKKGLDDSYQSTQGGQEPAVDIGEMDINKRPNETLTCLEFLLNVICKAFSMTPKQGAGLLTNANKYLNIAIIKGLKGEYEPVISLYQEVYSFSKHMTQLIEHEINYNLTNSTLFLMLNAFKGGFLSNNEEVVSWCCRLFSKIAFDFHDSGEIIGQVWDWFIDEAQGALQTCVQALQKYQYIIDAMVPVFVNFARYNFAELFTHHLRKYLNIPTDYLNMMHELIVPLNEIKFSREELHNSGTLDFFIEHCILKGDPVTGGMDSTKNDRQAAICKVQTKIQHIVLGFLSTLWIMFPEKFDKVIENFDEPSSKSRVFQHLKTSQILEKQSLSSITLTILKRNLRDKTQSLRLVSLSQLFRLLDTFSSERNQNAPVIYKTLIFALIENHPNELLRQHMMTNFIYIFERINTIPIGIMIDPIIKQIQMSEGVTYRFNVFDFDYFTTLAKHSRLTIKNAIQIVDLMAKAYLNEQQLDYQPSAAVPLMLIVTRFLDHSAVQEFIVKFVTVGIGMMTSLEAEMNEKNQERKLKISEFEQQLEQQKQKRVPKRKWPPEQDMEEKMKPPEETTDEIEQRARQLIRRHRVIEIVKKLIKYRNQDLNDEIKIVLLSSLQKFIDDHKQESKGICHILDWWWGKPQTLLQTFIQEQKQKEITQQRDYEDIERQYYSQQDQVSDGQLSSAHQKHHSLSIQQELAQYQKDYERTPQKDKSIMMKDVIKREMKPPLQQQQQQQQKQQVLPIKQHATKKNEQQQTKVQEKDSNDFYQILQKAQKDEPQKNEQPQIKKNNMEPVRHKFDEFQSMVNQKEMSKPGQRQQQKRLHTLDQMSDDDRKSHLNFQLPPKSIAQSTKNLKKNPELENQRNLSLPQIQNNSKINQKMMPFKKSVLDMYGDNDEDNFSPIQKNKLKSYATDQISKQHNKKSEQSLDDNYYQMLKYQQMMFAQKNNNNIKSQALIQNRELIQQLPYDNFLKQKQVDLPQLRKRPKDKKVLLEIEKIQQRKQEKEYKQYLDNQLKDFREQRQKMKLKQELERRKLQLGIAPSMYRKGLIPQTSHSKKRWKSEDRGQDDDDEMDTERVYARNLDVVILDEGERLPSAKEKLRKAIPSMQLVDINKEEEERDRIKIQLWMQKRHKLFKILFSKYANTVRNNVEQNFDFKDQKSKHMNLGEILKFAKDHGIYSVLLSKDEIQSLVRMIGLKNNKRDEIMTLNEDTFQDFFIQMAHNIFYCKQNKIAWSLLQQIEALLSQMQKAMLYKGENTTMYEDPEYVVGMDRAKLRQLNQQILSDPNMEIPEGYYKVYEREMLFDYSLPEYLPIKESKRVSLETLDDLLSDIFGIHFLEARGNATVVPKIKQQEKIVTGKHSKNLNEIQSMKPVLKAPVQVIKSTNDIALSENMKQEIDKLLSANSTHNKQDIDNVGLTLEAILRKLDPPKEIVEQVQSQQPQRGQVIVNKIQQDKIKQQQEDEEKEYQREQRRLQKERELKIRMSNLQQMKEGKEYDKVRSEKDKDMLDNEKKRRLEDKRQKEFEAKKKALEDKKQRDLEDLQRQQEEEQQKRRKENEYKGQQQRDFLKQQKEKIKQGFSQKINDRKELDSMQKQVQDQANDLKNKIKSNMVSYIEKTKDERKQQDERQKQEVNNFMEMEETRQIFQKYDKALKQYYKFYSTQDQQQIEFDLEKKNETINANEFVKFGYQSNIYPALITHEDLLVMFRQLVRERFSVKNESKVLKDQLNAEDIEKLHVIDYEYFKKSLVRIAALAQDKLAGTANNQNNNDSALQQRVQSRSVPRRNIGTANSQLNTSGMLNKTGGSLARKTKEIQLMKQLQETAPKKSYPFDT